MHFETHILSGMLKLGHVLRKTFRERAWGSKPPAEVGRGLADREQGMSGSGKTRLSNSEGLS